MIATVLVEGFLLLTFAALVLQPASWRLSICALLVLAHVDVFQAHGLPGYATTFTTFFKAILVPAIVLGRLIVKRRSRSTITHVVKHPATLVWLALAAYAAVAGSWSPYPLDAIKLVGGLVSHTLTFLVLVAALSTVEIQGKDLAIVLWAVLGLAALQSLVLGNQFGREAAANSIRITSFAGPQTFAEFLGVMLLLLLWREGARRPLLLSVTFVAIFLSGSRLGLVGTLAGVAIWFLSNLSLRRVVGALIILALFFLALPLGVARLIEGSRIGEVVNAATNSRTTVIQGVGTFRWREGMYAAMIAALDQSAPWQIVFGHGTSSAGTVALSYDKTLLRRHFSANRVVHDEPLRILYEGGIVSLIAYFTLATLLAIRWLRAMPRLRKLSARRRLAIGSGVSILPLAVLSGLFENVLQAALAPGIVAFLFVLALLPASHTSRRTGYFAPGESQ